MKRGGLSTHPLPCYAIAKAYELMYYNRKEKLVFSFIHYGRIIEVVPAGVVSQKHVYVKRITRSRGIVDFSGAATAGAFDA